MQMEATVSSKYKYVGPDGDGVVYVVPEAELRDRPGYRFAKRCFDLAAAAVIGVVLLIPMLIIGLIIRLDSPGPALFRQERLGKGGVPFMMLKFRSMGLDAEAEGPQWAQADDCRCTRVGYVLRKFRVDELPQLWNIFVGHMSFVGPRPERAYFYDEFETYIHGFRNRLAVTPGLTGLAQVSGGYDLLPEEKIVYDMEYIQNQSLLLDAKCILRTAKLVFTQEGAR